MKKLSLIVVFAFASVLVRGATVNWSATQSPGTGLVDDVGSGTAVSVGNWIRLGFFSGLTDLQVQSYASAGDQTALNSAFKEFAAVTIGSGVGNTAGIFSANSTPSYGSLDPSMPNHQMYLWALLAAPGNNGSASTAALNATAQAIFYQPSGSNPQWAFPANDLGSATIDINQATAPLGGVFLAGVYQASNASIAGILGPGSGAVQLQAVSPIPEPSTFAAGAMLAVAAMGVRRRRRG